MPEPITIVGGNVAGLSAAYHLARRGCPVTVYESRLWDKPCGGAISIEYANYLAETFGIEIPALSRPIPHIRFCFANRRCVETNSLFVIISRSDLQQQLVQSLQKEPNIHIIFKRITPENSGILSSQTVLATGFSGFTRRIIGRQWHEREYAMALKYPVDFRSLSEKPGHLMFFDSRLKGYGWFFYCDNRHCNAGIGGLIDKKTIFDQFQFFIKRIDDWFGHGIKTHTPPIVWKIPIRLNSWAPPVTFYKNNIEYIGVGDVLGLAHPVIAAGIEPAWQSGWLVGESYDRVTHSINIDRYRHLLKKNLRLTSRKSFDMLVSAVLRINAFPFKDRLSFALMQLFHTQIIDQIKKSPWFAMVHDGHEKTGFRPPSIGASQHSALIEK